jgi:hypothetical protein
MLRISNLRASYGLTVELSGLIFVALALVWAVVLIPKALKHHDEVARTRSVDQVSDAGRVLARREVVSEREARLVVPPRAPAARLSAAQSAAEAPEPPSEPAPVVPTQRVPVSAARLAAHRTAAKAAARRRRHIVAFLLLATAAVGGLAIAGVLLLWAPAIPAGLTVGFLVLARVLVRREHAKWDAAVREVRRPAEPAEEPLVETPLEAPVEKVVIGPVVETRVAPPIVSGLEETSSYDVALMREAEAEAVGGGSALWDPLPVTLPTYVSKPRATRSVRTIDLADPRVSSSGRDAADSALVAEAATAGPPVDGSTQRVVGG